MHKIAIMNLLNNKDRNAYVIFTREPAPGKTKSRLMPYYDAEQCAELHRCFLRDIAHEMKRAEKRSAFDIIVAYTGGEPVFLKKLFGKKTIFIEQRGTDLGQKMENAITDVLEMGYEKAVLTGTDIPELRADAIEAAFDKLDNSDVALGPTADGGYYLIGMKEAHHEAFNARIYGVSSVFEETLSSIRDSGLSVSTVDKYQDIDTREDLADFRERVQNDAILKKTSTGRFVMNNRKVSVIIPVYNEERIAGCMTDQLRRLTCGRSDAEVIFVDGGSTDRTLDIIEAGDSGDCAQEMINSGGSADRSSGVKCAGFKVISSKKGRGIQMNVGAEASTGDILFFLHSDSILPDDFIDEILICMKTHSFGCFGVRFRSGNFFMFTNRVISNHRALMRGLPFGDQGIFIDRKLFYSIGMFPEYPVMEDYELSRRLRSSGVRPAMTRSRITTSDRRYGKGTLSIVATEFRMWNLRRLYRKGLAPEKLAEMYKDER